MVFGCRTATVFYMVMMVNVFFCVFMGLSWRLGTAGNMPPTVQVPTERFWRPQTLSGSFWNVEQSRLDLIHNPLNNVTLEILRDWLSESGPADPCEADYRAPVQIRDYNALPQRFQDFLLYMRCRNYTMLVDQPRICEEKPFLLLAVKSLVPHFDRRQAIRETWGQAGVLANRTVATVFLLGDTSPEDNFPDLRELLKYEAMLHKDILQWDFRDTFFNLTVKDVLFLDWFSKRCPQTAFVLKGDDDVFVNTPRVLNLLQSVSEDEVKDFFVGDVITDAGPHRDHRLKYFIPESVYEGGYPPYAGGGGYLFSGVLARRLSSISRQVLLYPIDDVYTGMCLRKLGLAPQKHNGFRTFDIEEKYRSNPCVHRGLMLVHSRTPQQMLKIWPWVLHRELDCQ